VLVYLRNLSNIEWLGRSKYVIRSVLRLPVGAGEHQRVVDFYQRRQVLARALAGGCTAAELHVRLPGHEELLVTALWESEGAYLSWATSNARADDVAELQGLLAADADPITHAELYEVVGAAALSTGGQTS
jgi:heme-degrading monooxygenase HmoA